MAETNERPRRPNTWTTDELIKIGTAEELRLASRRSDGTLRNPVTIWVVRHDDRLYVRSVNGRAAGWFGGTQTRHEGHIQAGGIERAVTFAEVDDTVDDRIDAEYRTKYGRYAVSTVDSVLSPEARSATLELLPGPLVGMQSV